MAGGIKNLVTDDVREAARHWGISEHSAIFIEHASRGELRRTMPYVLDWLKQQRTKAHHDTLSPEKVVALDATMPGWRRLRPAELDREWAKRNGAPVPSRGRRRKKRPAPEPEPEIAAPTSVPLPGPGLVRIAPKPSEPFVAPPLPTEPLTEASLKIPESSQWLRVVKAAQTGTLSQFQGAFRSLRAHAAEGTLPMPETIAMDQAAPGWRSSDAEVLDTNWKARHAPPKERPRPEPVAPEPPVGGYAKSNLSGLDRIVLTSLSEGVRDTETEDWLSVMQPMLADGLLKPSLVSRMDALAPGWADLVPVARQESAAPPVAPPAPPVPSPAPRAGMARDRRVGVVVALASTGIVDEMPELSALLASFRDAAARGTLAPDDADVLDRALPAWRGPLEASVDASGPDAEPKPEAGKRPAFIEDFDQRSRDMLALAERGELATAGMTAVNWLIRERSRDEAERLAPHITARYAQVLPGWRGMSPLKLDQAWKERQDFDL